VVFFGALTPQRLTFFALESNRSLLLADDLNFPLLGSSWMAKQSFSWFFNSSLLLRLALPDET